MGVFLTIAGSVTTRIQFGIYTNSADTALCPYQSVFTSAYVSGSNANLRSVNVNQTLSANNLYWFCYLIGPSAATIRTVAVAGAYPSFGLTGAFATAPGLGLNIFMTLTNGMQAVMPGSGAINIAAFPAMGFQGEM
jgi:hypothetical protein